MSDLRHVEWGSPQPSCSGQSSMPLTLVEEICLTVVTPNVAACRLYSAAGFKEYGLERRALKVGSEYYDEMLMALQLSLRPELAPRD
jgi:hypothetical protein